MCLKYIFMCESSSFSIANTRSLEFGHTDNNFTKLCKKGVQIVFIHLTLENALDKVGVKESVQQKLMAASQLSLTYEKFNSDLNGRNLVCSI